MLADLDRLCAQASKKAKKAAVDSPPTLSPAEKAEKVARGSLAALRQQLQVDWGAVQRKFKLMVDVPAQEAAGGTSSLARFVQRVQSMAVSVFPKACPIATSSIRASLCCDADECPTTCRYSTINSLPFPWAQPKMPQLRSGLH